MAVYEPNLVGLPPWVRERVETQGITTAASVFRALAASASEDDDAASATAFELWTSVIESARQYPGRASARNTIMTIAKK